MFETRYSALGHPYRVFTRLRMPRIADQWLDHVVYFYHSEEDAEKGARSGASGFLVHVDNERVPERPHLYVVTNKHVSRSNVVMRVNMSNGGHYPYLPDERGWVDHPDVDLAICPVLLDDRYKFGSIHVGVLLKRSDAETLSIGIGDDIFMVGRFFNAEGEQRNVPTARFGHIAQMPGEKISTGDESTRESFLVECRSVSGYSGSPVFVYMTPPVRPFAGREITERRQDLGQLTPLLLGVTHCYVNSRQKLTYLKIEEDGTTTPAGNDSVLTNSGIMAVVPAWFLRQLLLDHPKVISMRKAIEEQAWEERKRNPPNATLTSESAPPTTEGDEQHKERFTALLNAAARKKPQGG